MSSEQVKGTLLAVGATAASTALIVGGFVGYNHMQQSAASVDVVDTFNQMEAKKVAAEDTQHGVFSDHCLVATVGDWTMDLISWVPEKPENGGQSVDDAWGNTHPAANILDTDSLAGSYNWQWVNRVTGSYQAAVPGTGTTYTMLSTIVANPADRTQANLNAWFNQIKAGDNGGHLMIGWGNPTAHCRWLLELKSNAVKHDANGSQLKDDVTVTSSPTCGDDEWLTVNGEKAHVTAHGRAYYTLEKPAKGNAVPAGATLIGEADLDFTAPGTQTATIDKPASLSGGYVTWVWSIEKNNQPSEWGKYLLQDATDGWAADDEVAEVPEAPAPSPSTTPSIPVSETPGTQPPAPSETQPTVLASPSEPSLPQPPSASLAHTGTTFLPLVGMSVFLLAGGVVTVLRKRNTI